MAGRNRHSFLKRQKERKRQEEAAQKIARRQGKTEKPGNSEDLQNRPAILLDRPVVTDETQKL